MSIYEMSLDLKKSSPIYSDPIVLRQGDTNTEILVHVLDNSTPKNLENLSIEFNADKPDATTIDDDEQSHFKIGDDKESFTYTVPDELTDASGSTTNTYFKIGSDSTSNFYIHILTKAGMEKLESGDYISKVDRIFNHVMSDYSAINDLSETAAATLKASLDKMNSDYVGFINSKSTEFETYLATLDSQAADVKNKYTALQTQVNNSAVGTNLLLGTVNNSSLTGTNISNQTIYKYSLANGYSTSSLASALGTKFTVSFDWSVSGSSPSGIFTVQWNDTPWDINPAGIAVSSSNTSGHTSNTFSVSADSKNIATMIGFRLDNFVGTLTISNVKLEKGSVATDWCPNPSEVLTQSDYAKIKAAIVALGGSLS